jgi:hypothetical protein
LPPTAALIEWHKLRDHSNQAEIRFERSCIHLDDWAAAVSWKYGTIDDDGFKRLVLARDYSPSQQRL